jgi:uncharacterized lipoprotein YbaY
LVRGEILFAERVPDLAGASVQVLLEDTSLADAASVVVARVTFEPGAEASSTIGFELPPVVVDERARYNVRVLVDLDHDGSVGHGDYITMQSYPVLTRGHPATVAVQVRRVP